MRTIIFSACLLTVSALALGQRCILTKAIKATLYLHQPNNIDVMVEGKSCGQFTVITDNGEIRKTIDHCDYILTPSKIGEAHIIIQDARTKKEIMRIAYSVDSVAPAKATVAGLSGGAISKAILYVQEGVSTKMDEVHWRMLVLGFTISLVRGESTIYSKRIEGALFGDEVKKAFSTLEPEDHVLISAIRAKNASGNISQLQPLEFIISR